jgi:glycosyltransferase involved in cell wall biosynthesis
MRVSIVITTFNRVRSLDNALRSVSLQSGVPFEVIVVNDGGVTVSDTVERWARHMPLQYVHLPDNKGLARARNEGIRRASGDILCFLDDDDLMLAGHLRAGTEALSDADVDAAHTHVAVCDEFVAPGAVPAANQIKAYYRSSFDSRLLLVCNFIPVNAIFIRTRDAVPISFDEELPHLEDWDLWLRLHNRFGYRFKTVPQTTAVYHRVPGFSSITSRAHASPDAATRFRQTFRRIVDRYPSSDALVRQGRALHDDFYGVVAQVSRESAFSYEQFVESMEAFIRQSDPR